jgi:hypothetical protein
MTFRGDYKAFLRCSLAAVAALALLAASGCSSSTKSGGADAQGADSAGGGHINVMCLGDRINSPTESFHYSYKYTDASGSADKEADITPQAMDITITDGSGTRHFHGVRADEGSWSGAVLDLSGLNITAMTARLDSLNGTSSISSQGAQAMNGYPATKYSIDTTSANSSDRKTFETLFGAGSYEKGTVWMGQDGCAVKLVLDEAIAQPNGGGVDKRHYEMARIKK